MNPSTHLQTPGTRPLSLQDSVGRRPDVDDGDDDAYNEPIILPPEVAAGMKEVFDRGGHFLLFHSHAHHYHPHHDVHEHDDVAYILKAIKSVDSVSKNLQKMRKLRRKSLRQKCINHKGTPPKKKNVFFRALPE